MHGVPPDLDLKRFVGCEVIQLQLGEHQLQVILQPEAAHSPPQIIGIEAGWELRDERGGLVDQAQENIKREVFRAHRLLGRKVVDVSLDAPKSFALRFDNGLQFRVFDDSPNYESFSIQPGDIFI